MKRRHFLALPAAAGLARAAGKPTEAKCLLMGNWADPTILRVGSDFYMTHSSFDFHPGLLIWHSKDLRRWRPVSRAIVNQSGSVWAPELIHHHGRFFLYYPADGQNWVVTADVPEGPWSSPVSLGIGRIDPGHVVGQDGKRYVHVSAGQVADLSTDGLKATSSLRPTYSGWPIPEHWPIECFCLESPKLTFRNGWYHLTSAQGGTLGPATSHMVVAARSRTPVGPWDNSPYNPIIRTWSRDEKWWSKGHGTLVEANDGNWYCVLHGIPNGMRSMGRSTLIEPIEWTRDDWYRIAPTWPSGWDAPLGGDLPASDSFRDAKLGIQWQFHGRFDDTRYKVGDGTLVLKGFGETVGGSRPLALMPMHTAYDIEVELSVEGNSIAGLCLFASPQDYIGYGLSREGALTRVQEGHKRYKATDQPAAGGPSVRLRIVNDKQDVLFYRRVGDAWRVMQPSAEVGHAGPLRPALFVIGDGLAKYRDFRYRPLAG